MKYKYKGFWSGRIDEEHRLIYQYKEDEILIAKCRFHYDQAWIRLSISPKFSDTFDTTLITAIELKVEEYAYIYFTGSYPKM